MKLGELNFLEYIGNEEQNLLTGIVNFKNEFDLFYNIDRIYQEPLKRLVVSSYDVVVPQLYLFVHFHLYFSMTCLLRSHLSETLSSLRKAIDASLCAYKIILKPYTAVAYLDRDKYFKFIKFNIQREIEKDSSLYPLAHDLVKIHDACSEYGSHSDISSFFHRAEIKTEVNQLVTAFGQSCSYRLFSHKSYLVIPKHAPQDEIARLDSLCMVFGIGLILFDSFSPSSPLYNIRVRPIKREPDMFYVNKYMKYVEKELFT